LRTEGDNPATKKPHFETHITIATAEAATKTASSDGAMALPPTDVDGDNDDANTGTDGNIVVLDIITLAILISDPCPMDKIAALVPGRTRDQCYTKWRRHLDPDRAVG
jgi:hypothetical protein